MEKQQTLASLTETRKGLADPPRAVFGRDGQGNGSGLAAAGTLSGTEFFDQDTQVIIQRHSNTPDNCWSSSFDSSSTKKNDGTQFKAIAQ